MKNKGQIFSLDFVLSIILIVLAFGLILQLIEINNYTKKDNILFEELKELTINTSDNLVNNPQHTCKINDISLKNCINEKNQITKNSLGIPQEYGCTIRGLKVTNCETEPPQNTRNIFGIKRTIVRNQGSLSFKDLLSCQEKKSCNLIPTEVEVLLWK